MKILSITFLSLFLLSCNSVETTHVTEQCTLFLKKYDDTKEDYCLCREYIFSPDLIAGIGQSYEREASYCNKMIGYRADKYRALTNYFNDLRIFLKGKTK